MRNLFAIVALLVLVAAVAFFFLRRPAPLPPADLDWDGPKTYAPSGSPITVEGFGIDAPVDILPPGTTSITISRNYRNNGGAPAPAGYQITEQVTRFVFQSTGTSAGWTPGSGAGFNVTSQTATTQTLAPGATATATFTFAVSGCGLYRETLTVNGKQSFHFFFVPSSMAVNIALNPDDTQEVVHTVNNQQTHTFNVTPGTPTTTFNVFGRAVVTGSQNSTGTLTPAPQGRAQDFNAGRAFVFSVTGNPHRVPITDILREIHVEQLSVTVTAITTDGCNVRQRQARVNVLHPGS